MTWTQDGVDYVCQKYGDINECVVSGDLVFDFIDDLGDPFTGMTGSTADIVSLVAFGLASSITMTTPSRSTILNPETELDNANRGTVTQPDAMELIDHDERSADQWCYIAPVPCSSYTNPTDCEANNCYWYDDGTGIFCHPTVVCNSIKNQADCERLVCYWYDGACHSEPQYPCNYWENQTECEANKCYWWNDACHDSLPACDQLNNQDDCERFDCYWYDDACHSTPQKKEEIPWLLYAGIVIVVGGIAVAIKRWR